MGTIDRGGRQIYYSVRGNGPPVLLAHSYLCNTAMWAPQIEALKDRYTVVSVDARGHGESDPATEPFTLWDSAADHLAVLDHLGHERFAWAGLSMGGMKGLRVALDHPERVVGLMLLDTDGGPESAFVKAKYTAMGWVARAVGLSPLMPAVGPIMFGRTTLRTKKDLVAEWKADWELLDVPSMLLAIDAIRFREDLLPRLRSLEIPALVLVGAQDKALPPARSKALADALPQATFHRIPDAGHLSTLEQPEAVNDLLQGFLANLEW